MQEAHIKVVHNKRIRSIFFIKQRHVNNTAQKNTVNTNLKIVLKNGITKIIDRLK